MAFVTLSVITDILIINGEASMVQIILAFRSQEIRLSREYHKQDPKKLPAESYPHIIHNSNVARAVAMGT